jgi:hypothetical protein
VYNQQSSLYIYTDSESVKQNKNTDHKKQTISMDMKTESEHTKNVEELLHTILAHIQAQEYTIKILKDALRQVQGTASVSHPPR